MTQRNENSFSLQMRNATKKSHDLSNALVNTKLAFALTDNNVWADGLLVFYEIFKYLEDHVPLDYLPEEFHRKEAIEKDLAFFLSEDWKESYEPRKAVRDYLDHLEKVNKENPDLLIVYVYHLYMGLLAGAQILRKKRAIAQSLNPLASKSKDATTIGAEITHFEGYTVSELKKKMRDMLDEKAKDFDAETKKRIFEESYKVFELNNQIIRTVQGVNQVNFKKLMIGLLFFLITYLVYKLFFV